MVRTTDSGIAGTAVALCEPVLAVADAATNPVAVNQGIARPHREDGQHPLRGHPAQAALSPSSLAACSFPLWYRDGSRRSSMGLASAGPSSARDSESDGASVTAELPFGL